MQKINYASLVQAVKTNTKISDDANKLANALIVNLSIPKGYGLAVFLNLSTAMDNQEAIRRWVQQQLSSEKGYVFEEMQCQLEKKLYDLLPDINSNYKI